MATDYDAPRKTDDEAESLDALKERVPDKNSSSVDFDETDGEYETSGSDLSDVELEVVVLPPQENEFTCVQCFLVKHHSQLDHMEAFGGVCRECAA